MIKGTTLLLAGGLLGSAITYGFIWSRGRNLPAQQASPQAITLLGVDEIDILRHAATGAWRTGLRAASHSEGAPATEVVTVPPEKVWSFLQKATPHLADRASLAREVQRELARAGCYDGDINGAWTTSTRQALKTFLDRVNAALPTNQPDAVLLALVKGRGGKVCGKSCPTGQYRADSGRCVPTAILPLKANSITGWLPTKTLGPGVPLDGQMSLAGPKAKINSSKPKAKPVQPERRRSSMARQTADRDWASYLWKKQAN